MRERIIKFMSHENVTSARFADEIGVQRSSVSHILSGRNNPSFEFIQKILTRYKNLNAEWLILGTGTMIKPPAGVSSLQSAIPKISQLDLFQNAGKKLSAQEQDKSEKNIFQTEIPAARKIEKIVLFYNDKTFEEFLPG